MLFRRIHCLSFGLMVLVAGGWLHLTPTAARSCTTAVISGRATADGRPLLWKQRDTTARDNRVVLITGGTYRGVAVTSAGSTQSIAMGVNEAGFCIENSLSRELPGGSSQGAGNGEFMKIALESCATVADFERLLEQTNESGRRTRGNFGVIDAHGGAAIFEAGHRSFTKFDANDPQTAPNGYVVRANFSVSVTGQDALASPDGLRDVYSAERFLRASALVAPRVEAGDLDYPFLLRHCCRDLADVEGVPYCSTINGPNGAPPEAIDTASTICRRTTVSAGVFHGVRPGEDPRLTTMWVILGDPAFSIAVPCWVHAGTVAEPMRGEKHSPLCSLAIAFRDANYDSQLKSLQTGNLVAWWSRAWEVEDELFAKADRALQQWRREMPAPAEVARLHRQLARRAYETIEQGSASQLAPSPAAVGN